MRPVVVVMVDIDAEQLLKLSPTDDHDPVEAVAPDGADPALGERVCLRRPGHQGHTHRRWKEADPAWQTAAEECGQAAP